MRSVQRGFSATFLVAAILVIALASAYGYFAFSQDLKKKVTSINSFEECSKHYPVMESYPEQCNTPDGKHFTRQLTEQEKQRLASPSQPTPQADETANWKTYTNKAYGYFLRYPEEYKITEAGIIVGVENASEINITNPKNNFFTMNIFVTEKKGTVFKHLPLESIVNENFNAGIKNTNSFYKIVENVEEDRLGTERAFSYQVQSNGYSGKWSGVSWDQVANLKVIESEWRGGYFRIYYNIDDPNLEKVISTFKFLK